MVENTEISLFLLITVLASLGVYSAEFLKLHLKIFKHVGNYSVVGLFELVKY